MASVFSHMAATVKSLSIWARATAPNFLRWRGSRARAWVIFFARLAASFGTAKKPVTPSVCNPARKTIENQNQSRRNQKPTEPTQRWKPREPRNESRSDEKHTQSFERGRDPLIRISSKVAPGHVVLFKNRRPPLFLPNKFANWAVPKQSLQKLKQTLTTKT